MGFRIIAEKLPGCGFAKDQDGSWERRDELKGTGLVAIFEASAGGEFSARLADRDSGEDYLPAVVRAGAAPRISEAFEALKAKVLGEITAPSMFTSPQAQRLADFAQQRFGETTDCPFRDDPSLVLRERQSGKWYAIFMQVQAVKLKKLRPVSELWAQIPDPERTQLDVINIKSDEAQNLALMAAHEALLPAWHMNHRLWLSAVLDHGLEDHLLEELLERARQSLKGKKRA